MLCSISTKKSNSKWLDRLRSSKDQADPQPQFSSGQPPSLKSTEAQQSQPRTPFLGDVLAEMFAFGPDTSNIPTKKAPRKMPNPKSYKNGDLDLRVLQKSDDSSRDEGGNMNVEKNGFFKEGGKMVVEKKGFFGEGGKMVVEKKGFFGKVGEMVVEKKRFLAEEDEKMDWNLSGFSRTEVTVIDTSYKGWKFEKVLFRKKSVWKVRDRKSRALNSESNSKMKMKMMKKRKFGADEVEVDVCKKKKKKKKIDVGECSLARMDKRGEFATPINDEESSKGKLIRYT